MNKQQQQHQLATTNVLGDKHYRVQVATVRYSQTFGFAKKTIL